MKSEVAPAATTTMVPAAQLISKELSGQMIY